MAPERTTSAPDGVLPATRGELESITDVHGTVAHFEMAYEAPSAERRAFGPPLRERWPSLVFLAFALALGAVTLHAYTSGSGSSLARWIVDGDRNRPMTAGGLALLVLVSALGTVARAQLRGVVVHGDGLEARYLLPFGVPRVRRWVWSQLHRLIVSGDAIALELWDGSYEKLPAVARHQDLANLLKAAAAYRKITVTTLERGGRPGAEGAA